jgi:ATP-dependent Lhr-like helicase
MTNSPISDSEDARSRGFHRLAEPVQRWIWEQNWTALRDVQERAIPVLLDSETDAIIAAATAGGKTEAAFLPLISRVLDRRGLHAGSGFDLLYVGPLRALINDQFLRLEELCDHAGLPVHPWHGDVSAGVKARARQDPSGILLITPESLEALFVLRGLEVPSLFGRLQCVVIDELHALLDNERGVHLRSLLTRLELATRRRMRRVGLSATLGDMDLARSYLRPDAPQDVALVTAPSEGGEIKLQLRGYRIAANEARDAAEGEAANRR